MPEAPNRLGTVKHLAGPPENRTAQFNAAHANYPAPPGPQREAATQFMHTLVAEIRKTDKNFYLNVKNNTTNGRFSQDAIAYWKPGMAQKEVYDVISSAGSPSAAPAWNLVDHGPPLGIALPDGDGAPLPGPDRLPAPNEYGIVRDVEIKSVAGILTDNPHAFTQAVAERLVQKDDRWGRYKEKGILSRDKLSWVGGANGAVESIDIINSAGGTQATTGWTRRGYVGGERVSVVDEPDAPPVDPPDEPPVDPPIDPIRLEELETRVAVVEGFLATLPRFHRG